MATLQEVIAKALEINSVQEKIEEKQAAKSTMAGQITTINSDLSSLTAQRATLVNQFKTMVNTLP